MLTDISIKNFAIVKTCHLEFQSGMTALTGETGAGKSIIIDALGLILGGRGSPSVIKHGAQSAELSAIINISHIKDAQSWLIENSFTDENNEIVLKRVLQKDGRSRHFINGQICSQSQIRSFAQYLVNIHGQHEHYHLLKSDKQRDILDQYANNGALLNTVETIYTKWAQLQQAYSDLSQQPDAQQAKLELLRYQVEELETLALIDNEFSKLEAEHKQLVHAEELREYYQTAINAITDENQSTALSTIAEAINALKNIVSLKPESTSTLELLSTSQIQLQEASSELQASFNAIDVNPERLFGVEKRLETIHSIARKHHVEPEELLNIQQDLNNELQRIENADTIKQELEEKIITQEQAYTKAASKLTLARGKAAKTLSKAITDNMQQLGMEQGQFSISLDVNEGLSAHGAERVLFKVSTNPGQPVQALDKVASGGEISRIGLALQMITAKKDNTPTLIFDEVDVGIGGGTAEIVGKLLRQLGEKAQILCITHLPQVAAQAQHHFQVQKQAGENDIDTSIIQLDEQPRIEEIARMLGGVKITEQTRNHAKEMLSLK